MLPAWLWLKIRKKWKPAYIKSQAILRKKIADPEKRTKLNNWYNKISGENKSLFFRLYAGLFKDNPDKISEGEWIVDFAGKTIRLPLRNDNLWLDWNLAIAIAGHNNEVKATYENLILSGMAKVVFDIGANYGTHSLLFLSHDIKTISFEPNPSLKKDFDYLCTLNQFNGKMENVAVGEKKSTATLWIPLNETWEATIVESELHNLKEKKHLEKLEVTVISVDEYVAKSGLQPDFIKIDTEGNEINVLKGALTTIHSLRPHIIFETNNSNERKIIWDFFRNIQYTILELPYTPGKRFKSFSLERFLKKGSTNYIAVPDSKLYSTRKMLG
jgi:FkbM family methyltransferase